MTTNPPIVQDIAAERQQRQEDARRDLVPRIDRGARRQALEDLLFFADPDHAAAQLEALQAGIELGLVDADPSAQENRLRFMVDLAVGLRSFLPLWNLSNPQRHREGAWNARQVEARAAAAAEILERICAAAPTAARQVLREVERKAAARLAAEKAPDPAAEAARLAGKSLSQYVAHVCAEIERSQLRRVAVMRHQSQLPTEISNDYAAFLQYALYLGASFATTNPPLVDMAWTALAERWTPVVDEVIASHPQDDPDQLARWVTLEVVLDSMRLLRPIFVLNKGQMGCVCLQVNPNLHGDAPAMVADAHFFYQQLQARLNGHTPNVVFKLPGTQAGLQAAETLTAEGIGVTITVQFGMFQHVPYARVLQRGTAPYSNLVEMNGRLAYPVRDELLAKLGELGSLGFDEASVRCAAAWAGVAVVKKLHRALERQRIDLSRVRPLIASLRLYEGTLHRDLPTAFPDVTEVLGTRIISVFPDIRRAFDGQPLALAPTQLEQPVPEPALEILAHSEIFRQAYHVSDPAWATEEQERFRPRHPLALADRDAVLRWPPIDNTLTQFRESYDQFVARIQERSHRGGDER